MQPPFIKFALHYISLGWSIFPAVPRGKRPLTTNGYKDATTDIEQVKRWWMNTPNANIAIATGKISNIVVVDVDGYYPEDWPPLDSICKVKTYKGYHLYFKYPEHHKITCRAKILDSCVDIRADGGYIIAPPSIHPEGAHYEFT